MVDPLATVILSPAVIVTLPPWPDCFAEALTFAFASTLTKSVAAMRTEPPPFSPLARVFDPDSSVIRSPSRIIRPPPLASKSIELTVATGVTAESPAINVPLCLITPATS